MTYPRKQPEAVTRHWGRQLTRQEIAEGVRRTLPLRVRPVAPIAPDVLQATAQPVDAVAAAA
jgi:hypothetical protein